ncbi:MULTISPECIES: UbiA prenyltransferase family protein [Thioalkalivibrio]|uniref:Prenyltransferase n=1 Tax=Thioalkalivibrio halophilus TaxID=252474 RepID=A0A1V2ZZX8_9GAMM|nr:MULTISPECIES: UbiA prenyltransferase family protein [Thioalkalivibrio]OOC10641.1 prenyltransferase [Thioalkalivibrio halophilus]PYG01283.1 4-hydroxybenzoate polyprenyltransferase and related prenyltransferases [Thioalkalivibrio sp. ALE21]
MLQPIFKLLRPHQYIKNGFVFLGPVFAHAWEGETLLAATLAFLAFCAMASAVYVLNDILDVEADRRHPTKCRRPLASGAIGIPAARIILSVLVVLALALGLLVSAWVTGLLAGYLVLNIAYSLALKHVVILDVFSIAGGFMLRILAGTLGLGIEPSQWLLLCGLMLTLFLGFAKRRSELAETAVTAGPAPADPAPESRDDSRGDTRGDTRRVLDDYSTALLDQFIAISAACTVIAYGLYTVSPEVIALHGTDELIYTLPFVIYGIFRYLYLLHFRGRGGDTSRDLFTDAHLLVTVVAWLGVTLAVLS